MIDLVIQRPRRDLLLWLRDEALRCAENAQISHIGPKAVGQMSAYMDFVQTVEALLEKLGMTQDDFEIIHDAPRDEFYTLMCGCIVEGRLARIEISCGHPRHIKRQPDDEVTT